MGIPLEWILNKSKQKIYAITHAKGVVRGDSTVDRDLTNLENSMTSAQTTINALSNRLTNISELIESGDIGSGGSAKVILGVASNSGDIIIPIEGWEEDENGTGYILDITNSAIEDTTVPVVAVSPESFETSKDCGLKSYCRTFTGILRLYADKIPTAEIEASIALIGSGNSLPVATTSSRGAVQVGNGMTVEPTTGTLSVDKDVVVTQDQLVDEEEALNSIRAILADD